VNDQPQSVYFISDAHLGSGSDQDTRIRTLVDLLGSFRRDAEHVYVLGDLFDFWFEYRHAIPKGHFRVLRALAELVEAGIPVTYLGGNHDFWSGSYLSREVGLHVHQHPITRQHQGRRLFLAHGDGLGPGDTGYRILKAVLRHRIAIALYRTIHPDLGIPLAYRISKTSRNHTAGRDILLERMSRYVVTPRLLEGDDAVIVGHIHDPIHLTGPGTMEFVIIGDWLEHFTYVRMTGGALHLETYRGKAPPTRIEPLPWPAGLAPTKPHPPAGHCP
jgi:UDP-2,3-diacylglucosamine hydrolase